MQNPGLSINKVKDKRVIIPLKEMFEAYCQLDPLSEVMDVNRLTFSKLNKWLIAAQIIDMSHITTTDAFLCFFQFRKRAISYDEFLIYLADLAETKNLDVELIKRKMQTCGRPLPAQDSRG